MKTKATLTHTVNGKPMTDIIFCEYCIGSPTQLIADLPPGINSLEPGWVITDLKPLIALLIEDDIGILIVEDGLKTHRIVIADITHGNVDGDYTTIFTNNKPKQLIHSTLAAILSRLPGNDFFQNDRNEFLARDFINSMSIGKGGSASCKDMKQHKIAFLRKDEMVIWFGVI